MRKVLRYMRVSTDDQARHGYSLEAQDSVLADYAAGHQLQIVESFVESESAFTSGKRPEFARMCDALRKRSDVSAVLVYKLDRLARNMTDFATLTEDLGATLISMTEGEVSDTNNQLLGGMHAVFARHYSQQLSQRVSLGLRTKAQKGLWPTYAPTGYVNAGKGIEPDPISGALITSLFDLYAHTQMSIKEVAAWARAAGLRSRYGATMYVGAIHNLLQHRIYYGGLPWKGEVYEGTHEPLVSRDTWDAVQEKMHGRSGPRMRKHKFPFRGLLTCSYCGCMITASLITNRHGKQYVYYHCTRAKGKCAQPFHRQEVLSDRLRVVVEGVHIPRPAVTRILSEAAATEKQRDRERRAQLIQLKADKRRIEELRRDTYLEKLEHIIEPQQWASVDHELAERGTFVEREIGKVTAAGARNPNDVAATFKLLERAPEWYNRKSDEERAELLNALASNCVLSAETILPNYRTPFDAVASAVETGDWLGAIEVIQTHVTQAEPAVRLVLVA